MKSILKNSNGNAVSTGGKLLGSPEGENPLQTIVTGKGVNAGYYLFYNYTGTNVDFIASIDFSANTTCYYMFRDCNNLQTIPQLDTSNVTTMYSMFNSCGNLQTIPQLNTSNVTNMGSMFTGCKNLQTIPQLDTSMVTNMSEMVSGCTRLQTMPQLDTSNVTNVSYMFQNCSELKKIDFISLDNISSTSNMSSFVYRCGSLTKLIIRTMTVIPPLNTNSFSLCYHFDGTVNSKYNPDGLKDGRIYVPDNMVEQLKQATNWSKYADIIVPLSTLEE